MIDLKSVEDRVTGEQIMLVILLVVSAVFLIEPVIENYPDDARVFPQLTATVVFIGSFLLLFQRYLPGPLQNFVTESVSIASTDDSDLVTDQKPETTAQPDEKEYKKDTLGAKYGYEVNDTFFMVSTAILFFIAGWSAGFLFVTPLYVLLYTFWFRIDPLPSVLLALFGTVIMYIFMTYLLLPFDQGHIFDFSPLLPLFVDAVSTPVVGGGA